MVKRFRMNAPVFKATINPNHPVVFSWSAIMEQLIHSFRTNGQAETKQTCTKQWLSIRKENLHYVITIELEQNNIYNKRKNPWRDTNTTIATNAYLQFKKIEWLEKNWISFIWTNDLINNLFFCLNQNNKRKI